MGKYNLPHEEIKRFEIYKGRNVDAMPKLLADGRIPMNVSQLMQRRLDLRNDDTGVKDFYIDNYFDTGDAVVYHPDDRVKIVLDSQHLRDMTPESPRNGGALILGEDVYKVLEGEEFKKGKLGKIHERAMNPHSYLAGLSDTTGEIVRYAVRAVTQGDERQVKKAYKTVAMVIEYLIDMDLTGYQRTKFDQAKKNLRKLEQMQYDLAIRTR